MNMENTNGLRKGGWTHEEDELLKACINKYGEGKWHLVSQRAGLNRCRKSCRLRWMNYLNPNINKERFSEDEVDLMLRLHKLLGNRWSLIAGRLPGRTANDVKNYWHTHLSKKVKEEEKEKEKPKETILKVHHHEVIKPQPRTFSSNSPLLKRKHNFGSTSLVVASNEDVSVHKECHMHPVGDAPVWGESLWDLEDQIGPNSLDENSILEFAKDFFNNEGPTSNDFNWDFSSILDL